VSTPYERLMAEELPTGTFGHAQPPKPRESHTRPWTPEEQAQHWADLATALNGWHDDHQPTLRLIQPDQTPDAA